MKQAVEDNRKIDVAKGRDLTAGPWAMLWAGIYAKPSGLERTEEYADKAPEKFV